MESIEKLNLPQIPLYTYDKKSKQEFFLKHILELFEHHCSNNIEFNRMMSSVNYRKQNIRSIEDLPFIPVRLFKLFELLSVSKDKVVKTMTSSGTTGLAVSKIFLDKQTSSLQTRILSKIVSSFLGCTRVPMIVIDCEATVKNRNQFSARSAGITGFSLFASKRVFALNDDMSLNVEGINQFLEDNKSKTIFMFGFTFIVYQHFYRELLKSPHKFNLSNSVLIHGGGWKKLISESVDNSTFKAQLNSICGLTRVHDYYGMVEQTGTIHMECENGYLHTSEYSDIIIRNSNNFTVSKHGEEGIIQLLSLLPISYPGQSILTEDLGTIFGEDDCKCGRKGKYFKINGRLKNAELRGCSDTYGESFRRN
jgi:phenylacetate-coenzyme A ligase PaaK-like adenylate-forming protein